MWVAQSSCSRDLNVKYKETSCYFIIKDIFLYLKLKSSAIEDLLFLSDKLLPNPGYTGGRDILGILSSVSSLSLLSLSSLAVCSLSLSSLAICSLSRNSRSNGKTGRFGGSTKKILDFCCGYCRGGV